MVTDKWNSKRQPGGAKRRPGGGYPSAWLVLTLLLVMIRPVNAQTGSIIDSLSQALLIHDDPDSQIRVFIALSDEIRGSNPEAAVDYALKACDISANGTSDPLHIESLLALSQSYIRVSQYQNAFESANEAIRIATEHHLEAQSADARSVMSLIYYELGDYESSVNYDFDNLNYFEEIGDEREIGLVLGNIGIDFINLGNYEKGLEYLKKSFSIAVQNEDLQGMAYQYNNIAGVYAEYFADFRMAIQYYQQAIDINRKLDDKRQHGIYLMNIGTCYSRLGILDSILPYYSESNLIFRQLNNMHLLAECQALTGEYYLSAGDPEMSMRYADTALQIGQQYDYLNNVEAAASLLHKVFLTMGDTVRAYQFAMIENRVSDTLLEQKNQKELYKLEFQYNFEKMDKIRQIAQQRRDTLLIVFIVSLISGLIILGLLYSRHRIKSKNIYLEKQSIEKELQFKNKELSIHLISLIKKNDILTGLSKKLVEIGKEAKREETRDAIRKVNRELRNSVDDKMLKEFTLRFQEVHQHFYDSLLDRFPELTPNELKLCAFLRLNMTTKEISDLTGQRILTIDHARYRLRKKLGISNSDVNLVTFLHQL